MQDKIDYLRLKLLVIGKFKKDKHIIRFDCERKKNRFNLCFVAYVDRNNPSG
jgi:hypothetical protein